jgi:hypothetical protein
MSFSSAAVRDFGSSFFFATATFEETHNEAAAD